jgi:hypothetical protein
VPDEDRLAEGDLVAELPGALVRGVGGGRVPVGVVGEGVGPGLLPGGAVGLDDVGVPVPAVDGDDHVVPCGAEFLGGVGDDGGAGCGVPGCGQVPDGELPGPPPGQRFE